MVNVLKNAFDKYFRTLKVLGYISHQETKVLIITEFLRKYIYSSVTNIGEEEIKQLNEIFECLIKHSCTIEDFPMLCYNKSKSSQGNIITQSGITIISNNGENLVTESGTDIKKFSDFAYQQVLGTEDFLAGYDSELNENIRVNVGSLMLTWQPI